MGQIVPVIVTPVGMVEFVLQTMEYAYANQDLLVTNAANVSMITSIVIRLRGYSCVNDSQLA